MDFLVPDHVAPAVPRIFSPQGRPLDYKPDPTAKPIYDQYVLLLSQHDSTEKFNFSVELLVEDDDPDDSIDFDLIPLVPRAFYKKHARAVWPLDAGCMNDKVRYVNNPTFVLMNNSEQSDGLTDMMFVLISSSNSLNIRFWEETPQTAQLFQELCQDQSKSQGENGDGGESGSGSVCQAAAEAEEAELLEAQSRLKRRRQERVDEWKQRVGCLRSGFGIERSTNNKHSDKNPNSDKAPSCEYLLPPTEGSAPTLVNSSSLALADSRKSQSRGARALSPTSLDALSEFCSGNSGPYRHNCCTYTLKNMKPNVRYLCIVSTFHGLDSKSQLEYDLEFLSTKSPHISISQLTSSGSWGLN